MQILSSLILSALAASAAAAQPWYIGEISSELMKTVVGVRSHGVSEAEASSIAKKAIDGALSPPQVTPLAQSAVDMLISDGTHLRPLDVLQLVSKANAAYGVIRASNGFKNFLDYISVEAPKFDIQEILEPSKKSEGSSLKSAIESAISKLSQDATGRQAISEAENLVSTIARDAGVHIHF